MIVLGILVAFAAAAGEACVDETCVDQNVDFNALLQTKTKNNASWAWNQPPEGDIIFWGTPFHSEDLQWGALCAATRKEDSASMKGGPQMALCAKKCADEDGGYTTLERESPLIEGAVSAEKNQQMEWVHRGEKALFGTMTGQSEWDSSKYDGRWWEECYVNDNVGDYRCLCRMYYRKGSDARRRR